MGVTAGIMILMYYSVVAGWSLEYVYQSATSQYISLPAEEVAAGFLNFLPIVVDNYFGILFLY